MGVASLKGKFLEYTLRRIFLKCGFSNVKEERPYIFKKGHLLFINGKGAAHDADVLMYPPIQMPFSYPVRILFECKCYEKNVSLAVIRNAHGLRDDINNFEIVTDADLSSRQNDRRATLAIANRKRYFYQVGVASINGFTKPAQEFAANHKIFLFSLSKAFPSSRIADLIDEIDETTIEEIGDNLQAVEDYLSDREETYIISDRLFIDFVQKFSLLYRIVREIEDQLVNVYVGMLESGELIFIHTENLQNGIEDVFRGNDYRELKMKLHFYEDNPNMWELSIEGVDTKYWFYLPDSIARTWAAFQNDKKLALNIKASNFSKLFVFSRVQDQLMPFKLVAINEQWLNNALRKMQSGNNPGT